VRPDDPRVRAILRRAMIVRLATRSPAGGPFVTPIWFVVAGDRLIMATGAQTVSVRNLRAHPEAVLLLDADRHLGLGDRDEGVRRLAGPRRVDPQHRDGRPGPDPVDDPAGTDERHAVEHASLRPEAVLGIVERSGGAPDEALDGDVSRVVVQRR
jgi:hypothetical protein